MTSLASHRGLVLVGTMALGCGPRIETDHAGETDETSGSTAMTTSETTHGTSMQTTTSSTSTLDTAPEDSGEVDSGPKLDLPVLDCDTPDFTCTGSIDCDAWRCGGIESAFDETGCLRRSCTRDEDCPEPDVCFTPADWGLCASSGLSCQDGPNAECTCVGNPDCGGAYCIPAESSPPAGGCDDAVPDGCVGSGCQAQMGRPILPAGGSCACDLEELYCLWWPNDAELVPTRTTYVRIEDQAVVVFPSSIDPPPLGWIACDDVAFPPPGCTCAANLPCAMN